MDIFLDHPYFAFAVIVTLFLLGKYGGRLWRAWRLRRAGIADIDRMSGGDFELYLETLFKRKGFRVRQLPLTGDWGADLIVEKDGKKTAVQAKRYNGPVGLDAVQEIFTANAYYGTDAAMVVSNSRFTRQARHLADRVGVELWDRAKLVREILAK